MIHKVFKTIQCILIIFLLQVNAFSQPAKWTLLIYLDGDNNLEDAGIEDMNEMEVVGSGDSVNILVQFDRIDGYDDTNDDWTDTRRFRITQDSDMDIISSTPVQMLGEVNMGHPQTLTDFINWGVTNYPAEHYMLVLWNHGGGWRKSGTDKKPYKDVCWDDTDDDHLSNAEVQQAIQNTGVHFSIIGFDACLMGMLETAFMVKDDAGIMVASEETEPWDGWDYENFLAPLIAQPSMSPDTLAKHIVQTYGRSYSEDYITQSAIDLTKTDSIIALTDTLITHIVQAGDWNNSGLARDDADSYYDEHIDLWGFVDYISTNSTHGHIRNSAAKIKGLISRTVISNFASSNFNNSKGIAIYFPDSSYYDNEYDSIAFAKNSLWDEFIKQMFIQYKPDDHEPNDHFALATPVRASYTYNGYLRNLSDIDIFQFYNEDTNNITIQLDVPNDFDLYLYSVHDSVISVLDTSKNSGTINEEIVYNDLPEGIYYILSSPNDTSSSPFSLEITGFTNYSENEHAFTMAYDFGKSDGTYYNENTDGIAVNFEYDTWDDIYLTGIWYYITDIDIVPGNGNNGTFNMEILDGFKESLMNDSVISVTPTKTGWNYVDLSELNLYFWNNIFVKINWDGINTPGLGYYNNTTENHTYIYEGHDSSWHINDTNAFLIRADMNIIPYSSGNDSCLCDTFTLITSDSGSIDDASGSNDYANNSDCQWLIQPPNANQVSLSFTEFDLEDGCDYVYIYDGTTTSSTLLAEFTGNSMPYPVMSSGGSMLVHFDTDGSVTEAGWTAVYDTAKIEFTPCFCDSIQTFTAISDTISDGSSIYNYKNNTECSWLIQPLGANQVSLQFIDFETEEGSDYVYIYDGATTSDTLLATFSGYSMPYPVMSSGGSMLVHFDTDGSVTEAGWSAVYDTSKIEFDPCTCKSLETITEASGTINDGSGIYQYDNNTNCKWLIQPPGAEKIKLKFTNFSIEEEYDFVSVYDGESTSSSLLGEYTGYNAPDTIYSTGNSILIHFESDNSYTDEGWDASFSIIPLPDTINPTITCIDNQAVDIQNTGSNYYTVTGTAFDPLSTDDNIQVADVTNDYNNSSSLQDATFPPGDTSVTWTVTDAAGNEASCIVEISVSDYVGYETQKVHDIAIFPNPTTGMLHFKINDITIQQIIISDITGKTILYRDDISEPLTYIDLSKYENGMYIVHVITQHKTFDIKILKE